MTTTLRSKKTAKSFWYIHLVLIALLYTGVSNAQVSGYTVDQLPGTLGIPGFLPASPTKTIRIAGNASATVTNEVSSNIALPFTFTYNGVCYTHMYISVHGFVVLGNSSSAAPSATLTAPIANNGGSGVISVYGAPLMLRQGIANNVSTYHDVANGIYKVEWIAARYTTGTPDNGNLVMQLWLYETTNVVEMHYYNWAPSSGPIAGYGQIGLRGADNTDFVAFEYYPSQIHANPANPVSPNYADWPAAPATMAVYSSPVSKNATNVMLRRSVGRILAASNRLFRFTPPVCFAPIVDPITTYDSSTATVTWANVCPAPSGNYNWEIRTDTNPGTGGAVQSGTNQTSPLNISGLSADTTYYVYVQSDCGGSTSGWSVAQSFHTPCTPVFPYFEYFDADEPGEPAPPALPFCTSRQQIGTGNLWETTAANEEGFFDEHLVYPQHGANDANVWFFTRGVSLTGGTTYRLSYEYGGSTTFDFLTNRMEVRYGTNPSDAAMTAGIPLADHFEIKDSPVQNVINFTPGSSGTYYIGFRAYSENNNGRLFLDTIELTLATCFAPTALSAGSVTPTSATVSWTPPATVPASGYQYYLSTSDTPAPTGSTTPTGTAAGSVLNLSGLTPGTTYYFWVRSNCGSGDMSGWSSTYGTFATPAFPSVSYCTPNGAGFSQDPNGITNVTIGTINNTTGIELPNYYGNYSTQITSVAQGTTVPINVTLATGWAYSLAVWVDWNNDGDFADAGELVVNGSSTGATPTTVTMNFNVPGGASLGIHRMRVGGIDSGFNPPGEIPLSNPCRSGNWQAYEDYSLFVTPAPAPLTISTGALTTCSGVPTTPIVTLTSNPANYTNYAWSPSVGVTGDEVSGWQFAPTSNTVYTLTGFNSSNFQSNTTSITITVNQPPTPITIAPVSPVNACQAGPAVALTASGGIVSGQLIHYEGFNGGFPTGWQQTFTGAGVAANGQWQVRPAGYDGVAPPGVGWGPLQTNDNTAMMVTDSDAAGSSANFTARLTSPSIFLDDAQFTTASLSFWQYFRYLFGEQARVLISTDNFASSTTLATYTATVGGPTTFSNAVFDLTPYIGENIRIRFEYFQATWDWGWAIDNFLITGSGTSAITWSPVAGLYSDAAATIPYTAGTGAATVYAMPSVNTTYTASAQTGIGCQTSTTVTVNVQSIVAGTVSPSNQTTCNPSNLTLSGTTGTIVQWQYASNVAFTVGVTSIPASASATLTPAQFGSFTGVRYFRAQVSNGGCTAYSNVVSVTLNTKTWNGAAWVPAGAPTSSDRVIFQGNYTQAAGTLNACSVRVESGNVVFNSGTNLVVQNEVVRVGGTLTFQNNASLVQVDDTAVNSGYITYIRNAQPMVQYDYTYWSSPLYPQTLVGLSPLTQSDKYFAFDPIINDFTPVNANTIMDPGKGYIVRAPEDYTATPQIFAGTFNGGSNNGVPNNGEIFINIVSPTGVEDYNLIGNPYPSAIDADVFYDDNSGLIDGNFYFWTHNTPINPLDYTQSDYAQWNSTGGTGTAGGGVGNSNVPDGTIAAGQGFFVVGNVVTAGSPLVFNNFHRLVGSNGNFYRPNGEARAQSAIEKHRVWLEVTNEQGAYKQTLVGYVEGATNEKDNGFDGAAADGGNIVAFYSINGPHKFGIQGRALPFDVNDQVPMGFKTSVAGTYSIGLSNFDGLFNNQNVYIEDLYTNVIHNLKESNYSFTTTTGVFEDRFVLRYTDTALGVDGHQFNDNSVVIYKNHAGINIHSGNVPMDNIKIFDIRGRLVTERKSVNATATVITLDIPQQVLIVQVTSTDEVVVTKKIVY